MGKVVCAALLWAFLLSAGTWAADLTQEQRQQFLDAHNGYRQEVSPTATDMKKMKWNFDLEEMAKLWADGCVYKHGDPNCTDNPFKSTGQNMFAGSASPTPEEAVTAWNSEVKDYTYETMACTEGEQCGHYTQVVWANSMEVGCGITECTPLTGVPWEKGFLVICNYGPAGNFIGEKPFTTGDTSCSECGDLECEDKLCVDKNVDYTVPDTTPESQMKCSMDSNTAGNKTEDKEDDETDEQVGDKEGDNKTDQNNNEDKEDDDGGDEGGDDDIDSGSSLVLPYMLHILISVTIAFIPK